MLDAIEIIKQYCTPFASADDFYNDSQAFDASLMNFIVFITPYNFVLYI